MTPPKKPWQEIQLLEVIAVFLLLCTVGLYLKTYLGFEANTLAWLAAANDGEGMSRAEALGLSGDFLGGVLNPVLSFFSFLALLFTLRLQRRELNATMDELKKSTIAAESNVRLFTEQIAAQRLDAFENTFFALLKVFNTAFEKMNEHEAAQGTQPAGSPLQRLLAQARTQPDLSAARQVLMADHSEIDHFISILFEMLKFIEQKFPHSGFTDAAADAGAAAGSRSAGRDVHSERMFYANILKAIINQDAFEAVAMYAATHNPDSAYWAFKQLIEKYELLQELDLRPAQRQKFMVDYATYFPHMQPPAPL